MKRRNLYTLGLIALGSVCMSSTASAMTTHTIDVSGFTFSPSSLTVAMGDTVDFVWGPSFSHSVVSGVGGDANGAFTSGAPQFGPNTYSLTFDADFLAANTMPGGVYSYFCAVHVMFGMVGSITVTAPLLVNTPVIDLTTGGAQVMTVDAGIANASQLYWVFGTTAGFSPGFLGLPLNFSNYLLFTINSPNTLIANQFSFLDIFGVATPSPVLALPPGLDPGLAGVVFHHAYVAFDIGGTTLLTSNAQSLTLIASAAK